MHTPDLAEASAIESITPLFERSPHGVVIVSGSTMQVAWLNQAYLDSIKSTSAHLKGSMLGDLPAGGDLLPFAQRAYVQKIAQPFPQLRVDCYRRRTWLTGVAAPWNEWVVLQFHDSTTDVRQLQVGERGVEQLLEQIPFPVVLLSEGGEVMRTNNRAQTRLGLSPGLRGAEIVAALKLENDKGHPLDADRIPLGRLLEGDSIEVRGSLWDRLLGERRDCILYAGPVRDRGRVTAGLLTSIDVTDLRQLERAKDEFINIAGHELRTPLTAARTYLQLALRRGLDNPQAEAMVENAVAATRRMQRLINDILETERLETGRLELQLERRDVCLTVADTVDRLRRQLADERSIELTLEGPLVVEHDPVRLEQIIGNLLSNALRHTPKDRTVRIRARGEKGLAVIQVEDEGEGIPNDEIPWVFERLFRGQKSRGDGLGVGLFIAKLLVELHGGRIAVLPRTGGGVAFYFNLPLAT